MLLNIMRTTLSVSEELHRATKLHSFPHDLLQQPAFTQPHYKYPNLILLFIASHFTANKFISNCREASGCSLLTPIDILTALICTSSIGLRCLPQPHTSMQKHRANKHFQQLPKYPPPITCTSWASRSQGYCSSLRPLFHHIYILHTYLYFTGLQYNCVFLLLAMLHNIILHYLMETTSLKWSHHADNWGIYIPIDRWSHCLPISWQRPILYIIILDRSIVSIYNLGSIFIIYYIISPRVVYIGCYIGSLLYYIHYIYHGKQF